MPPNPSNANATVGENPAEIAYDPVQANYVPRKSCIDFRRRFRAQ